MTNTSKHTPGPWIAPWNVCRVCKVAAPNLIKYGTRHYAHADCAMAKWGASFFDRLTPWQASQFPYFAAKRAGVVDALIKRTEQQR